MSGPQEKPTSPVQASTDAEARLLSLAVHAPGHPVVHACDDIAATAGPMILAAIDDRILKTGVCRLALSGGSTPAPTYAWLREHIPHAWYSQLLITWVDERHLQLDAPTGPGNWASFHGDSNLRLAYQHWLKDVPIAPQNVLPLSLGGQIGPQVVRFGRAFLAQFAGRVDVAIIGAGPDGHIASIFPDHPSMAVQDVCFAVHDSPKPPLQRVSLALSVLNRSGATFVLARGEAKAAMLQLAYDGAPELPLSHLRPEGELHWVLDRGAAHKIVSEWAASNVQPSDHAETT
jgi:6-phosphogluconolactonase